MNNLDFIASSAVASGLIAFAVVGGPRIYSSAVGKPPYRPNAVQSFTLVGTTLILGLMSMRFVCDLMLKIEPPRWSALLLGPMFLLFGVQQLVAPYETNPNYVSARTTAYIMCAMGFFVSILDFSEYLFTART